MDGLTQATIFRALPDEAPLAMPAQSLRAAPAGRGRPGSSPSRILLLRVAVIGGAVAMTALAVWQMKLVLSANGLTPLAVFMLVLFTALFAWIALSFTSALAGFAAVLRGGGRRISAADVRGLSETRTALLMPCYNEDPSRVMAGLQAMAEDLADVGAVAEFDIFVLSDTTDPDAWVAEEAAFLALRERVGAVRVYYRRRKKNFARKAGNIADWVTRWGGAYENFLILDADSIMQADTLLALVAEMQAHPDVGLIQTLPVVTGGMTLFARLQQFAGRVYGPLIAHGIASWHGSESNYWGHNALIRTLAFADHAGLPELSGRKPFGGHILSHDFVEAALLRRAGWAVHMLPALPGSFEQSPPNLIDLAVRDRRWCQGNLQHAAVLPARGLTAMSRLHLLTGIGSYLTAPLWLAFLLTGILIALQARFVLPDYFPEVGKSLFPVWPVIDPVRAMWMFIGTMSLLLVPKLLGCALVLRDPDVRRGCGGAIALLFSLLLETVIAGLLAPVVMLSQSSDVVAILAGRDSGWNPQRRDDGSVPLQEVARRYGRHTLLGVAMGVSAWLVAPSLALWMSPVVVGLALSIPLVALTSRRAPSLARAGVLRIPEERTPPAVLARVGVLAPDYAGEAISAPDRLLRDPALLAAHRAMLPPARRPGIDPIEVPLLTGRAKLEEAPDLHTAWRGMTRDERAACLADPGGLDLIVRR